MCVGESGQPVTCGRAGLGRTGPDMSPQEHPLTEPFPPTQAASALAISFPGCTFMSQKGDGDKLLSTLNSHDTLGTQFQSVTAFKETFLPSFFSSL